MMGSCGIARASGPRPHEACQISRTSFGAMSVERRWTPSDPVARSMSVRWLIRRAVGSGWWSVRS